MKIIYKSITDEILTAKETADRNGRTINKIILTYREYQEFMKEAVSEIVVYQTDAKGVIGTYAGITLQVKK